MRDSNPYRLSPSAIPFHYELTLRPDLSNHSFSGSVSITVEVPSDTPEIELNAVKLIIESASAGSVALESILDPEHEILRLVAPGGFAAGSHEIALTFRGALDEDLAGFYRSNFVDDEGTEHTLATTQFEATDARKAFPCFDEPDLKATFTITIETEQSHFVVSNYPIASETTNEDGSKTVVFERTMPMSTYLVAFVIGNLEATEPTNDSGIPLRIITPPNRAELTTFAKTVGHHALAFFTNWFDIPYPAPKLDMIAVPDFAAGAMENLGAVTYREALLLVDETQASKGELERVTDVICHEIAHMWFGDLVTMKWWNGIWLNEAFATYMELLACDAFRPEWRRWESFGISRLAALDVDGLPSTRPIEYEVLAPADSEDMFDLLTYEKGASILRMLELYLGTDHYRKGITNYLTTHKYGNAETSDLWDAIEEATGKPVRAIMDSWVFQGGHPVIEVARSGNQLTLSQRPFRYLSEPADPQGSIGNLWKVPVRLRIDGTDHVVLLEGESTSLTLGSEQSTVVANAGGAGVFRTRYVGELSTEVLSRYDSLSTLERFNLIADAWALTLSGEQSLAEFAAILRAARSERDPNVLGVVINALSMLDRIAEKDQRANLCALTTDIFGPLAGEIGLEAREGESLEDGLNRAHVYDALGAIVGDPEIRAVAAEQFRLDMSGVKNLEPNLARAILGIVARHGEDTEFAFILDRYRNPRDPQDRLRNLYALASFRQPRLHGRTLEMTKSEIRIQDAFIVLARLIANPVRGREAMEYVMENWEFFTNRFPVRTHVSMLYSVETLVSPESYSIADTVFRFAEDHPLESGGRILAQHLERYQLNLRFRARYAGNLDAALAP
ncbi:MAG: M1 family metallopeptidase [Acidimicrobiales bacterium]